jgi:hypothetical protein
MRPDDHPILFSATKSSDRVFGRDIWAALRKARKDVGLDGKTILNFDEMQKMNPAACSKTMTGLGTG